MRVYHNYLGQEIAEDEAFLPIDMKYFTDPKHPDWSRFIQFGDDWGFDIRVKMNARGHYIDKVVLPEGKKIIRYGVEEGAFTADAGTPYEKLSMPYVKSSMPFHEYVVCKSVEVECYVDKGIVAPGFGSSGGVIQYRHYMTIRESLDEGILKEDYEWLSKLTAKKM